LNDIVNSPNWHTEIASQPALANSKRLNELHQQDFARSNRYKLTRPCFHLSGSHYLDVFSISINPMETNAKLIVNANAMLTGTDPFQQFQMIPRRISASLEPCALNESFPAFGEPPD